MENVRSSSFVNRNPNTILTDEEILEAINSAPTYGELDFVDNKYDLIREYFAKECKVINCCVLDDLQDLIVRHWHDLIKPENYQYGDW